jgi:uncharacterized protein (TIGR02001 family)
MVDMQFQATRVTTALALTGAAFAATAWAGTAQAEEKRELGYSFNVALTSDYVFRGFTQTAGTATGQAGFDITWGKFYAGIWGSGLDFGRDANGGAATARGELDLYAGFKPEWNKITFDFGVIYYAYPGARDNRGSTLLDREADYWELKAGSSREIWKGGTLGGTFFYSPDYTNSTGRVITSETTFTQEIDHKVGGWTPTLSVLVGNQYGRDQRYRDLVGNGDKKYMYWNAGVAFAWEKFTIDFRYWDTNIKNNGTAAGFCSSNVFGCDERYVATLKFTY